MKKKVRFPKESAERRSEPLIDTELFPYSHMIDHWFAKTRHKLS
jgi:hypothetical protein